MSGDEEKPGAVPKVLGREPLRPPLPKRFYKGATVSVGADGAQQILLDGRPLKTPKKRPLAVHSAGLAEAMAAEWAAQGKLIDPATMPLTRIANTAIDAVADAMDEVRADVVAFAGSDLVCYRAADNEALCRRQAAAWDPVVAWARQRLGARFVLGEGVMPVEQPTEALDRVAAAVGMFDMFQLSALHVLTTITGSALLALAHANGALDADAVWAAAHVDEDFQIEFWGPDAEAEARRVFRRGEFDAASRMLRLLAG